MTQQPASNKGQAREIVDTLRLLWGSARCGTQRRRIGGGRTPAGDCRWRLLGAGRAEYFFLEVRDTRVELGVLHVADVWTYDLGVERDEIHRST